MSVKQGRWVLLAVTLAAGFMVQTGLGASGLPAGGGGLGDLGSLTNLVDLPGAGGPGGSDDPQAPTLVSSVPANGAKDVPTSSAITFVFDQPMLTSLPSQLISLAVKWSGNLTASKFNYTWEPDGETLTCTYTGGLPGGATITWTLNPAGGFFQLTSADGTAAITATGSFITAGSSGGNPGDCHATNDVPVDFGSYSLFKMLQFEQKSASPPSLKSKSDSDGGGAQFFFSASSPAVNPLTAVSLRLPQGTVTNLESFFGGSYFMVDAFATREALDAAYPAGSYLVTLQRATGAAAPAVTFPNTYPSTPQILNFDEAQKVNATADFTLRWTPFVGAGPQDSIGLSIADDTGVVFYAPDLCIPRPLPVTATSIVVPKGTLVNGKTYRADLTFSRQFYQNTNSIPNIYGWAAISVGTEFPVVTLGGGGTPGNNPSFTSYSMMPGGLFQITLKGQTGKNYVFEASDDLVSWTPAGVLPANGAGEAVFTDAQGAAKRARFYRAKQQ